MEILSPLRSSEGDFVKGDDFLSFCGDYMVLIHHHGGMPVLNYE